MLATLALRHPSTSPRPRLARVPSPAAVPGCPPDEALRRALAKALARAERAERRLRSRLLARTWPATLAAFAGGFTAVIGLRLAGL
jgi:hypothetical protein